MIPFLIYGVIAVFAQHAPVRVRYELRKRHPPLLIGVDMVEARRLCDQKSLEVEDHVEHDVCSRRFQCGRFDADCGIACTM